MTRSLSGKVALVAGGSRGIGAAIVRRLHADGAIVAFTYVSSDAKAAELVKSLATPEGQPLAIKADSADPEAIRQAVEKTVEKFGRLDILVNNAGILIHGMVDDVSVADFDRMVAINVRAVFFAAQVAVKFMGDGGRVITIGSVVADRTGFPGSSIYSMTKSAIAGLTRGLARDLGPRGITVNNVQPGPTATDMTPADASVADKVRSLIALGRLGEDREIAGLVAYLAGPESSFITGSSLTIDGGYLA
ncbi:3-oxoacyl-ACP reductase family protein [Mesorhizobium shangrilense]|uniref:3-oxoacyl-ACP reductase family protein n=1 Tax=Mesorhizobium shangrilense TaxID=460060 RepID=A0ABV2DPF0_9HYPH